MMTQIFCEFTSRRLIAVFFFALSVSICSAQNIPQLVDQCMYQDEHGFFRTVTGLETVPEQYRANATCRKVVPKTNTAATPQASQQQGSGTQVQTRPRDPNAGFTVGEFANALRDAGGGQVRPGEVQIDGNARTTTILSNLGPVNLRFPRTVENWFRKTPDQSIKDAWLAASRAIAQNGFPQQLRTAKYDWNLVFMDAVPGSVDVGGNKAVCHPAWMHPPADIYVAAERVLTMCGADRAPEAQAAANLTRSLVHELGHAVEFQLLGKAFAQMERWRSEGFATWFETLANQYVSGPGRGASESEMKAQARVFWRHGWTPDQFQGTPEDYARSYALIAVIAETKSVPTLSAVYRRMDEKNISIAQAVKEVLQWDTTKWLSEAAKFVGAPAPKI